MSKVVRIRLKAFEHQLLDAATLSVVTAAKENGTEVVGPVPLPTEKSIVTILRSPHVNKKSREQFEIKRHKRMIELKDASKSTVDALMDLSLPAGVELEVKL